MTCAAPRLLCECLLHAPGHVSHCLCHCCTEHCCLPLVKLCLWCRGLAAMMSPALSAASTLPPLCPLWLLDFREPGGVSFNALHRHRWHCSAQAPLALHCHAARSCCTATKQTELCRRRRTAEGRRAGISVLVVGLAATLYHSTSGNLRRWCRKAGGCGDAAGIRWQLDRFVP